MSRIDEALKRASESPFENRAGRSSPESPARPADIATLEHYPLESMPGLEVEPRVVRDAQASARAAHRFPTDVRLVSPLAEDAAALVRRVGPAWASKLVTGGASPVLVEQYRRLAAALHDAQIERGLKTLMVTSAIPREGKTLTVVNLALTLSESYERRVLVIDADLRKPSLHDALATPNDVGLSDTLAAGGGALPIVDVTPRLSVLTAGRPDSSPLAGLTSDRMRELLDECETRFDWVILDTPPVAVLPDAQLLARLTRAVVLVIGAGSTPFPLVERAVAEVGRDSIIGTVLNGVEQQAVPVTPDYYENYGASGRS